MTVAPRLDEVMENSPRLKRWMLQLGHGRTLLVLTLFAVISPIFITLAMSWAMGITGMGYVYGTVIATLVPAVVAPLIMTRIVRLTLELETARAHLHYLATHDSLTAAYNRTYFLSRFEAEVQRSKRTQAPLSVMMIDVDAFKAINDCYGHIGGDIALEAIAGIARSRLRPQDVFARYGGEEFIVLLPDTSIQRACQIAERIRAEVASTTIFVHKEMLSTTVSIGLSSLEHGIDHVIDRADAALYMAKRSGRNRWAC